MKKLVLRLDLEDDKAKQKAMKTVSTLQGIDSIAMDMKEKKMTVIGTVDLVNVVSKLRKYWQADIITVGPAKEPAKEEAKPAAAAAAAVAVPAPEEGKKEEGKKEEGKKEEGKEDGGKKEEGKGEEKKEEGKKEEGGGGKKEGGGGGKKEEGEAPRKPAAMMPQPIPEHLMEMVRARQYNPYGNYPPYMAMANPYMNHPQMHHQPTYYVQSVEENPNGCTIF